MTQTMPTEFLAFTGLPYDQRVTAWNDRLRRLADHAAAARVEKIRAIR